MQTSPPAGCAGRPGFTLIELLVVIAIIALLVTILMPSLSRARELARAAICSVSIRGVGLAEHSYTSANNMFFTKPRQYVREPSGWTHAWHDVEGVRTGLLWPYVESEGAYLCPTFMGVWQAGAPLVCGCAVEAVSPAFSYTQNTYLGDTWSGRHIAYRIDRVQHASDLLLFGEEPTWYIQPDWNRYVLNNGSLGVYPAGLNPTWGTGDTLGSFHLGETGDLDSGTTNVCFVDGHVSRHHHLESCELGWENEQ